MLEGWLAPCGRRNWSMAVTNLARTLFVLITLAGSATMAAAQTATSPAEPAAQAAADQESSNPFEHVVFGVGLEGFYQYNWNTPYDRVNLLRAYDTRVNVFGIQQANLIVESVPAVDKGRRFGARVDLQFGMATDTVQGNPVNEPRPEAYRHLWQVYGTYVFPIGANGLQVDIGKYASMLGYETNYAKDNQSFSRAYLFNFLPYYHSGVRVTLPVNDKVSLLYMLSNGIQQTEDFNDFKSNHVAAIVKHSSKVTWIGSYYFGQEQPDGGEPDGPDGFFRVLDTNITVTPTSALSLAVDANYTTNEINSGDPSVSLLGVGAYARYQVSGPSALSLRYERLDDEGLFGGIEQVLQELTATVEYKFADGFLVRGEFRRDWSNQAFFTTDRPGDLRDYQHTALVGLVWWFGNKTGAW